MENGEQNRKNSTAHQSRNKEKKTLYKISLDTQKIMRYIKYSRARVVEEEYFLLGDERTNERKK